MRVQDKIAEERRSHLYAPRSSDSGRGVSRASSRDRRPDCRRPPAELRSDGYRPFASRARRRWYRESDKPARRSTPGIAGALSDRPPPSAASGFLVAARQPRMALCHCQSGHFRWRLTTGPQQAPAGRYSESAALSRQAQSSAATPVLLSP